MFLTTETKFLRVKSKRRGKRDGGVHEGSRDTRERACIRFSALCANMPKHSLQFCTAPYNCALSVVSHGFQTLAQPDLMRFSRLTVE